MSETHEFMSETEPLLSERESKPFNNFAVIAAILLSVGIGISLSVGS